MTILIMTFVVGAIVGYYIDWAYVKELLRTWLK